MNRPPTPAGHAAHFTPEDLLELALAEVAGTLEPAPSLARAQAEARACATCARALEAAIVEVSSLRSAVLEATPVDEVRAAGLARSVLAATTREDLTWRGDWRVVGSFLGERLRTSRALRLLAASLLVHLLALPLLALVLLQRAKDERRYALSLEIPAAEVLPETPYALEPRRELEREPVPDAPGPLSYAVVLPEQSPRLVQARRELLAAGAPQFAASRAFDLDDPVSLVARLLAARSLRLALGGLDESLRAPTSRDALAVRALWAELLLDDWAIAGKADPRLARALQSLVAERAGESSAERDLARLALDRAAAYGAVLPGEALLGEPRPALSRAWFAALEAAVGPWAPRDSTGTLAAWLGWGRGRAR